MTELGKISAESVREKLKPDIKDKIDKIVQEWKDQPKSKIIEYIIPRWYKERSH